MTRRVGIVGLGSVAAIQLDALQRLTDLKVLAGVDLDPEATLTVDRVSLPVYRSVDELVARHDLYDIIVGTPTGTHAEI